LNRWRFLINKIWCQRYGAQIELGRENSVPKLELGNEGEGALSAQLSAFAMIKVSLISNNGARKLIMQVKGLMKPG
jgi:hypothetical protein